MKYIKGFNNINESMSREGMINVIRNILRESYDLNNNANIVDVINEFMSHFQKKIYAPNLMAQQIYRQSQVQIVKKWFQEHLDYFQ